MPFVKKEIGIIIFMRQVEPKLVQVDNVKWPAAKDSNISLSVSLGTHRYCFGDNRPGLASSVPCTFVFPEHDAAAPVDTTLVVCVWDGPFGYSHAMAGKVEVVLSPMISLLKSLPIKTKAMFLSIPIRKIIRC